MNARFTALLCLAFVGLVSACGSDTSDDAAADTGIDTRRPQLDDATNDTGEVDDDTRGDTPLDTRPDTGGDTRPDSVGDTQTDSTFDSGSDTARDVATDTVDASAVDPAVLEAQAAAAAAHNQATTVYCDCYRDGPPYNGNNVACVDELDGLAIPWLPCDATVAATYPADAAAFYACRQGISEAMGTCFGGCAGRIAAVTGCVVTAATDAVACGTGRDPAFVAAYEACHP